MQQTGYSDDSATVPDKYSPEGKICEFLYANVFIFMLVSCFFLPYVIKVWEEPYEKELE